MIKIYNAENIIEAIKIIDYLNENGIACYYCNTVTGEFMEIFQKWTIYGKDIYVNDNDRLAAKQLLLTYLNEKNYLSLTNAEELIFHKLIMRKKRIVRVMVLCIIILFVLFGIVTSLL